jgi:hypothetical protein
MTLIFSSNNNPGPASFPTKQNTNNGNISNVYKAMPSQFYPSANTSLFSSGRIAYSNDVTHADNFKKKKYSQKSSSELTYLRRVNAIGKSSIQSLATQQELSFRSQDNTSRNTAIQRCRAGGCTAPAKKGANKEYKSGGGSFISSSGNRQV